MYSEVAWVQLSSGTQVQPEIILGADYFPDCLSVSYHYAESKLEFSKVQEMKFTKTGFFT